LFPQIGGHSSEKIALQYVDEENEDVDVEILDAPSCLSDSKQEEEDSESEGTTR
jgi:hypothetical protein